MAQKLNDQQLDQVRRGLFMRSAQLQVIRSKKSSAVVYINAAGPGRPSAAGFVGRSSKRAFYYGYKDRADLMKSVVAWIQKQDDWQAQSEQYKAEQKAKAVQAGRGVEVGDVLRASWGYDQTNIDYYQVTALVGKAMVEVREIASQSEQDGWLQGKSVPAVGKFVGKPMRKVAKDGRVKIDQSRTAYRMEPVAVVAGARVYKESSWTAYA